MQKRKISSCDYTIIDNFWLKYKVKFKSSIHRRFRILKSSEDQQEDIMEKFIMDYMFTSYDFFAFFGFGLTVIWYWLTGQKVNNVFGKSKYFACSELGYKFLRKIKADTGVNYVPVTHPESVWPDELLQIVIDRPDLFEEIIEE